MQSRSHEKWTTEEDLNLLLKIKSGGSTTEIARELGRSELAISSRLVKHIKHMIFLDKSEDVLTSTDASSNLNSKKNSIKSKKTKPTNEQTEEPIAVATNALDIQQAFHRFHFVYTVVNAQSQVYVGYSQDVWHRVAQHNKNKGAIATRNKGPWFPFSITCLAAEIDARALESEIQKNFTEFSKRSKMSIKEVLAQIGVPFELKKIALVR